MKLSDTHIGDILILNHLENSGKIYYVLTNIETILIGTSNLSVLFSVQGNYIGKIVADIIFFPENVLYLSFTLNDFRKDLFPHSYPISKNYQASVMPHDDMPLLIDITNKSKWFEPTFNKEVENHGQNIYDLMKDALIEENLL